MGPSERASERASERSEFAGLVLLSSVSGQRGRAKLAEQPAVLSLFLSVRGEGCVLAEWGLEGDRARGRGASRSRERRSKLDARGSRLESGCCASGLRACRAGVVVAASVLQKWVVRAAGCQFPSRPLGVGRAAERPGRKAESERGSEGARVRGSEGASYG